MHPELQYTTANISAFLLAFIPGLINLGLAAYVFFKMPSRHLINIFVLILITSGCWQFANAFMRLSADAHTARFWDCIFSPIGLFATPLLLHFALVYTDKIKIRGFKYGMYFMYFVLFIVTSLYGYVNTYDSYAYTEYWGWINTRANIPYAIVAGGLVVIYMLANVIFLLDELPSTPVRSNKFYGLILISGSLFIIVVQVTVTELLFPILFRIPPAPLTPTIMLSYSFGTFLALTVYHFFKGEESINKTDLLNSVSDIIIVVNGSLKVSYINKAGLEQIGATQATVEGEPISNFLILQDTDASLLNEKLWRLAEIGQDADLLKCELHTFNGINIPILVKVNMVHGNTNMGGLLLLCRNIHDVEIAQEETERNDRRFRKIIERSKDAMAIINMQGHVIYASPSVYNVIGYSPSELEGNSFMDFIHPESKAAAAQEFAENISVNLVKETVTKVFHKSGRKIDLESVAINYFDDPDVGGLVVVFRDITERMLHLEEIRRHSAYLEQLFEASPFGIVMVDDKGNTVNVNKAFEKMFQFGTEELKGKSITDFIVPEAYKKESRLFFQKGSNKKSISTETVRLRKDGSQLDVFLVAYPIILDDVIYGAYVLYLDISNQKNFEHEIINKNKELTKINRELDKFVYSASHDIRSPLMSILGLVNIAKDEISDPIAMEYLQMIKGRVLKLDEFTLDIIHFAKNARTDLKPEKVNIKEFINEVVDSLKHQDAAQAITFEVDVDFDEEFVTDKARLHILLGNLISNSIKYKRQETGAPYVKVSAKKLPEQTLEIVVEDNGEGIEKDKQASVFDMFSRFSTRSQGSGLGLYIVKEIIEKFGGSVHIKSEKNVGSEFTVSIPELHVHN